MEGDRPRGVLARVASRSATLSSVTSTPTGAHAEVVVDVAAASGIRWTRKPRRRWWRVSAATCSRRPSDARRRRRIDAGQLGPRLVVPHERHPSLVGHVARLGLGDVVQQRAEAQRLAARQLVGQRLVQQRPQRRRLLLASDRSTAVSLSAIVSSQHRAGVAEHVEMVKAALLDAVERGRARAAPPRWRRSPHQLEPGQRAVGAHHPLELGEDALGGDRRQPRRARAGGLRRAGLGLEPQLAGQPRQAQTRSGSSPNAAPDTARRLRARRSATPPNGSTGRRVAPSGSAIALTVRSRRAGPARSSRPRAPSGPAARSGRGRRPPGAERLRELERVPAARRGRPRGRGPRRRPATTTSKSAVGRPSSRSRTAPPTSQAGVPSSASARSGGPSLTRHRRPVTVVGGASPGAEIPQMNS